MKIILYAIALVAGPVFAVSGFHLSRPDESVLWPFAATAVAIGTSILANRKNALGRRATFLHFLTFAAIVAGLGYCIYEAAIIPRKVWFRGLRGLPLLKDIKGSFVIYSAWSEWLAAGALTLLLTLIWRWAAIVAGPVAKSHETRHVKAVRRRSGWMRFGEVRKLCRLKIGMPLGAYLGQVVKYAASAADSRLGGHHAVIAGTRAGKGVAAGLPAIIDHDGPVVVIDIKGENFAVCRRWRESLGRQQVVLNPFGLIDGKTSTFNPMMYPRQGAMMQRDIAVLADGLIMPIAGEARWISLGARDLTEAALELILTHEASDRRSLAILYDMLCGPQRDAMLAAWTEADQCGGRLAKAASILLSMGDRQRGAILGHIAESLSWLKYDAMQALTAPNGPHEFSYQAILEGMQDSWLVIPQDMTQALSGFMRVVLNTTLGAITRQDGKTRMAAKLLAVMDEFTRLGEMQKVIEIATIAAGAGVEAVFIAQDLGQLEETYGPNGAMTILGSCATTRIFGLGSGDIKTARWAESLLPEYRVRKRSRTRADGKISVTESEGKERLLTAAELLQLPAQYMLTRFRGKPGVILEQIVSHEHPAYRDRLDPNPVVRA